MPNNLLSCSSPRSRLLLSPVHLLEPRALLSWRRRLGERRRFIGPLASDEHSPGTPVPLCDTRHRNLYSDLTQFHALCIRHNCDFFSKKNIGCTYVDPCPVLDPPVRMPWFFFGTNFLFCSISTATLRSKHSVSYKVHLVVDLPTALVLRCCS